MMVIRFSSILIVVLLVSACGQKDKKLFSIRKGAEVGIDFQNTITTNDSLNALTFEYIYNGSGVGVGDFNNDGLEDLVFGGNQVSSKIYLNNGSLQFTDITEQAGLITHRWITGVSIVDINQDGLDDIYFCVAGQTSPEQRKNLLYINLGIKNGIPVFEESSKQFGLDDDSYSTMAAFFDYDKDGDLDMYLVNNWLEKFNRNNIRPVRKNGESESTDKLYRNNGDGTFTDVSREAGILIEGYGLGVVVNDINQDSWPDVYVSNDFLSSDLLWINQKDGTFKNEIGNYLKHETHNGMGMDIADFNNDQLDDIIVVDMLPPDHKRQKLMTPGQNYDHFHLSIQQGFQPQYMRNTLQLNRGKSNEGMHFSEIAFMAGVAQTDWSWAPLFADVNNDGLKDLFIGNGYRKDVTDLDFIFFGVKGGSPFGTQEARQKTFSEELKNLPDVKLNNYIFENTGTLTFKDKTKEWGIEILTFSNGAAYADLDNDGDLDLITNNIDQEVIIYENNLEKLTDKNNFISISCADHQSVFNEKIIVYTNENTQSVERTPYRGFQSTVTRKVHFGIGKLSKVDSVEVWWPDSTVATYKNISANTFLTFSKKDAVKKNVSKNKTESVKFTKQPTLYVHNEKSVSDIKTTRTLLHELSRYGPCLAVGDVNNDTLDDLFVGGEFGSKSKLFIQQQDGNFREEFIAIDSLREDGGAHFFDADNDGDMDLYIAGSSPSATTTSSPHLLYQNSGNGKFTVLSDALPEIQTSASCVVSADYDGDGDLDLFVSGRLNPGSYPLPARSYLLRNDQGKFTDVTREVNPALEYPGLVASAIWTDINLDGRPDLVLAGEWMPIRIFKNTGDTFEEITKELGLNESNGWWNCIKAADLNGDGYPEIIAGNTGRNSYFKPTIKEPVKIFAKDFDNNGSIDPLVTYYNPVEEKRFLVHNRLTVIDQIPVIKKKFETFTQYAITPFEDIFNESDLNGVYVGNAFILASCILINKEGKSFDLIELPEISQISTINDVLVEDINNDGFKDIILVGNNYAQETLFGMYDASVGTILLGDGKMNWTSLSPSQTEFIASKDAKMIRILKTKSGRKIVISNNNDALDVFNISRQPSF